MDKATKQKYKSDFAALTQLVNSFDPCELIRNGAPLDEYDGLTHQILSSIYKQQTRQEIRDLILQEIGYHFGTPDLATLGEPYKTVFYRDLDKLLDEIHDKICKLDGSTNA